MQAPEGHQRAGLDVGEARGGRRVRVEEGAAQGVRRGGVGGAPERREGAGRRQHEGEGEEGHDLAPGLRRERRHRPFPREAVTNALGSGRGCLRSLLS